MKKRSTKAPAIPRSKHADKADQLEQELKRRQAARQRNEEGLEQFITDARAVFGLPAGKRVLLFLQGTFGRPIDETVLAELSSEAAMKLWQRRAGAGQVLGVLQAAIDGGQATVTDHAGKSRKVVLRPA